MLVVTAEMKQKVSAHRPTVAWVDAMTARRAEAHGTKALVQYRHRMLVRHGLPTTKRAQKRLAAR